MHVMLHFGRRHPIVVNAALVDPKSIIIHEGPNCGVISSSMCLSDHRVCILEALRVHNVV